MQVESDMGCVFVVVLLCAWMLLVSSFCSDYGVG